MTNWTRAAIRTVAFACAIVALGLASAGTAVAQDSGEGLDTEQPAASGSGVWSDVGAKTLDAAIFRPVGAVSSVVGFGFFLAATPFVAPFQGVGESWDIFVMTPVDDAFQRTLGDL